MRTSPPNNFKAEYYAITGILSRPYMLKMVQLKLDHFYSPSTKLAYQVIKSIEDSGKPLTLPVFAMELIDKGGNFSEFNNGVDPLLDCNMPDSFQYFVQKLAEECAKRKIWQAYQDLADAPLEFVEEVKRLELAFIDHKALNMNEALDAYEIEYEQAKKYAKEGRPLGLTTGFNELDTKASMRTGNLVIIAAKTSVGKTALSLNMAYNAAMYEQNVLFFSAEMQPNEIMSRMLSQAFQIPSTAFRDGQADSYMVNAKKTLPRDDKFRIVDAGTMTSADICSVAQQEHRKAPISLIVVDYIQFLKDPVEKGKTNTERVGNITRSLKGLAMELKCVVVALSQVNRAAQGMPELHHLRDSGNIEQDADIVMLLHREPKSCEAELNVAKNRSGTTYVQNLRYFPHLTKFYE